MVNFDDRQQPFVHDTKVLTVSKVLFFTICLLLQKRGRPSDSDYYSSPVKKPRKKRLKRREKPEKKVSLICTFHEFFKNLRRTLHNFYKIFLQFEQSHK